MGGTMMNAITVLLVCLAAVSAVPAHFPRGKTVVYKYHADVKAGVIQPAPFASQFSLGGRLHVRHDTSDPTLHNAYYVTLTDVKFGLHNGHAMYHEQNEPVHPIGEVAKTIQDPFLIVYDENSRFQGVKLVENESGWSKNVKQAIASMLQLDLPSIHVQTPVKPHSFITVENTIHGNCNVSYDVHPKHDGQPNNIFVVTKLHEPKSCSHFVQRVFDQVEPEHCQVESEDGMSTASRRVLEIEDHGDHVLIKTLIAHGVINYFPWQARSEAHYLLTNQTLTLENVNPVAEDLVPPVNFHGVPITHDITFNQSQGNYAHHAAEDITQGRHIVKLDVLIPKLKKMLTEAADYLKEDHLNMNELDWKHGQTLNRLVATMSYMDVGSLEQVYNTIHDARTSRNIFVGMLPHVGTTASCLFIKNVIRKSKVPDLTATMMLSKLPMHVRVPSQRLLLEMEDLVKFGGTVSLQVRTASILSFATLIHKTFMHEHGIIENTLLERYLQHFLDHVQNEPTYHMKMVYMLAIKNVGVPNIVKLLEPIIRGDVMLSEKPHHIRVQAIWAIKKVVVNDLQYAHDLLWPILADVNLPLSLRIAAYEVLVEQIPHMGRMMNLYWFMVYEKNEHLYNFHVTNIKSLANSVDPCMRPVREMARKLLRFTRMRNAHDRLSSKTYVEYVDPIYGYGEGLKTALILDEVTGFPHVGSVEYIASIARKPVNKMGIHWSISGLDDINQDLFSELFGSDVKPVINEKVRNVLNKAAQDMPPRKNVHVDICITMYGRVVTANHYDRDTWENMFTDIIKWKRHIDADINLQHIQYENMFEMQVPTDMGLPAVLATRMPHLMSLYMTTDLKEVKGSLNLKMQMDGRCWKHGEYVMSIYNPIVDVWHSVRRVNSLDMALPIEMTIGYNNEAKSLKVTMPRLPMTKLSAVGKVTHSQTFVTVTEDEVDALKQSCATCHHHEPVTIGKDQQQAHRTSVDLKDTGLHYLTAIFNCENQDTPVDQVKEFIRAISPEHKNTMQDTFAHMAMAFRQMVGHDIISPEVGACAHIIKIEPSVVYPTSHADLNVRMSIESLDPHHPSMHVLSSKKIVVRGTWDLMTNNASVRSWDVNVNIDMSQGHINNNLKVQITRVTPQEKNLKICIDAQKSYPLVEDPLRLDSMKLETYSKLTFTMGETNEDMCVRDDTAITVTMKGELSDEQKKQIARDHEHGVCAKDIQNPIYQTGDEHIPKTWGCLHDIITHTTLRKYTMNVAYKKVPQSIVSRVNMLQDIIRAFYLPHLNHVTTHSESGTAKISMDFPVSTNHLDVSVATPTHGYELVQLPLGHPVWNMLMDNTHASIGSLNSYLQHDIKLCVIYPQVLITFDNGTIPFALPTEWTLISGDYVNQTFAVFARVVVNNQMAIRVQIGNHELEMIPTESYVMVHVDGMEFAMNDVEKGLMFPADDPDNYAIKLTKQYGHLIMQSERAPISLWCTSNSVMVVADADVQGLVSGMCGHMDGTHKTTLPKVYTVPTL